TVETCQKVQANIVAAKYDVQRLAAAASDKAGRPSHVQTFVPRGTSYTTVTFVNTTGVALKDLRLSLDTPKKWSSKLVGTDKAEMAVDYEVAPGQTVVATFAVKSGKKSFNGDLKAVAKWTSPEGKAMTDISFLKVRNAAPVKINEYSSDFIELYNASDEAVNISGWTLTNHPVHIPYFSSIEIPNGTVLGPKEFYLLGMSNAGLAVDAAKGDKVVYLSNVKGMKAGDEIKIGDEVRKIAVVNALEPREILSQGFRGFQPRQEVLGEPTTVWQPLPDGPVITIPAGSTNIPVTNIDGFREGGKMAIGYGATYPTVNNALEKYEVVTITKVGKPGTQAYLSMDAKPGDTNIKVSDVSNISVGDKIRLDIESMGHGIEVVTVKTVGTASSRATTFGAPNLGPNDDPGTGLELEEPLKFHHASNLPFSVQGTGIDFEPATRFDHSSNEPVLGLAFSVELDTPLAKNHSIDEAVVDAASAAGYHGAIAADQLFGGPVIGRQGNMTLRDKAGNVVETVNYGAIVDPWLSEGYQADSGFGEDKMGNFSPSPLVGGGRSFGGPATLPVKVSAGRYPDGADTDDNKVDFKGAGIANLYEPAKAGQQTIVVSEVNHLTPGTILYIDGEKARVGTVGEVRIEMSEMRWGDMVRKIENRVMDITLSAPLKADHARGAAAIDHLPTPGLPNKF
ncbi:MAG: lamin tail domain-containing protein, partial [Bacteroidales bacterium]|nr:lamin tail domain-containing protein [Bacteroidales bacterium]